MNKPQWTNGSDSAAAAADVPDAEKSDEPQPGHPGAKAGRSEGERPSPTQMPGIPGHGMTSNAPDDGD